MPSFRRDRHAIFAAAALLVAASIPHIAAGQVIDRWSGQYATVTEPQTIVATTAGAWRSLLGLTGDAALQSKPFDEAHQTGIGIFLGRRSTGGYGVQVVSMRSRDGRFVVEIDEQRPTDGSMVTQSLTSPWLILLIDRPELPISIEPRFHAMQ
jgi:hypothetical protein